MSAFDLYGANAQVYESREPEVLLAGAAGSGKSLAWLAKIYTLCDYHPGARCLIVRKTRESLTESVLVTWERDVLGPNHSVLTRSPTLRRVRQSYRFRNGSEVVVGGMDKPDKVLSSEWDLIYCFPGDTRVESPSQIQRAFKRPYSGPLVAIETATGNRLTGTPNHPILTDFGWVPLGELKEGMNVICRAGGQRELFGNPNINHGPAPIAEVAGAFLQSPGGLPGGEGVALRCVNFDGDGADRDVQVVLPGAGFHVARQAPFLQPAREPGVVFTDFDLLVLERLGASRQVVGRSRLPSYCGLPLCGPLAEPLAVAGDARPLALGRAQQFKPAADNFPSHDPRRRSDVCGDLFETSFPFKVSRDRVVHLRLVDQNFCGHVYNLRTRDRYYVANGIIAHNCPEATDLTLVDWETLGGRLRAGRVPFQQLGGDCNPTTPHHFLYKRQAAGLCRMYTSRHQDNPRYYDRASGEWTAAGKQYLARLERMTGSRRARFLEGKWVAAEGVIYDYDPDVHLLPADWVAPAQWPRVWSIDWGKTAPTVLLVWAVDPEGRMYLTREIFKTRLRPDVLGKRAAEWIAAGTEPPPKAVVCDHDEERKEAFEKASGLSVDLADKKDRDKGIEAMQSRFDRADDGRPRIFFRAGARDHPADAFLVDDGRPASCVEELAGYVWDPDFLADEPIAENDHAMDAARYACRYVDSNYGHGSGGGYTGPVGEPLVPDYLRGGSATGWL